VVVEVVDVIEKPIRDELCKRLKDILDDVIAASVRAGMIRDPDVFTSLIYYVDRVSRRLDCKLFE